MTKAMVRTEPKDRVSACVEKIQRNLYTCLVACMHDTKNELGSEGVSQFSDNLVVRLYQRNRESLVKWLSGNKD